MWKREKAAMKGNNWTITDGNGMTHQLGIQFKTFSGPQITVDGNIYKVKSSNWLVNIIDYSVDFPGANCHIVMIGNKTRLAVNGTYNDDGTAYVPVASLPAWVWVLVILSVVVGFFVGRFVFAAIGVAFSTIYISAVLNKKTSKAIIFFVLFVVLCAIWYGLQLMILPSLYPELYR